MQKIVCLLGAVGLFFGAADQAYAQEAGTAPATGEDEVAPAVTVNGGVSLVSDYRLRGISQSNKDFAVQGWISATHKSGLYGQIWGSSIDEIIAAGSDQEIDFVAGYRGQTGDTSFDVGVAYYYYPGSQDVIPGYSADFVEPFVYATQPLGPVSVKVYLAYAPKQRALSYGAAPKEDNFYAALDLSGSVPNTGLTMTGHVGRSFSRSLLTGGRPYTDWSLGASYNWKSLSFGVTYVDTSFKNGQLLNPINGKNLANAGVMFSLGAAF